MTTFNRRESEQLLRIWTRKNSKRATRVLLVIFLLSFRALFISFRVVSFEMKTLEAVDLRVDEPSQPLKNVSLYSDKPNPDFEFERLCPPYPIDLPDTIDDLQLFYHIGMLNNWKDIVNDQMKTLLQCGLIHYASSVTISYSNGDENAEKDLDDVIQESFNNFENSTSIEINLIPGPGTIPWEGAVLNSLYNTCQETQNSTAVFYFHSKGTSSYRTNWKETIGNSWTYSQSLYWRKFLEYFTLENPNLCLTALANGAYTCGPQFTNRYPIHYSGNFWSAHCDYIKNSKNMKKIDVSYEVEEGIEEYDARTWLKENRWEQYVSSEFWIGKGYSENEKEKFIGLYKRDVDFYNYLIRPKEYVLDNIGHAENLIIDALNSDEKNALSDNLLKPLVASGM